MIMGGCIASVLLTSSSTSLRQGCCLLTPFPHFGNLSGSNLSPRRGSAPRMCRHLACLPRFAEGSSVSHCCRALSKHSSSGLDASLSRCSRSDGWPSRPGCPCSSAQLICQSLLMLCFHRLHCKQRLVQREHRMPPRGWITLFLLWTPCAASHPAPGICFAPRWVQMLGSCPRWWQRVPVSPGPQGIDPVSGPLPWS